MPTDGYYTAYVDNELTSRWVTDALSVLLTKPEYSPGLAEDTVRTDIPVSAIVAEAVLQNVSVAHGRLLCDSVTFTGVAASSTQIASLVVVNNTTGNLVAAMQSVTGLQIAPNGNDIVLHVHEEQGLLAI